MIYFLLVSFIFGSVFTSFFTLIGMRVPEKESIDGRSRCDQCKEIIPWYGIIPVFGYFILLGKCKHCNKKISLKYPIYELLGGMIFAIGLYVLMPNWVEYIIYCLFVSLMIIVTVSDIEYFTVPDVILLMFAPVIVVLRLLNPLTTWYEALLGGFLGFGFMLLIAWYGKKRFKQDALGGGDIKLYFIIGVFLEVTIVFMSLFFASILGIIIGKTALKKINPIPFVPFIFAGSLLAYFFGKPIFDLYVSLF